MNWPRRLLRLLRARPPLTRGTLRVEGGGREVVVRRDRWGVPSAEGAGGRDAGVGPGFCHGQDRSFQLEFCLRASRGALAELLSPAALAADRLSRRAGFRNAARRQLAALDPGVRADLGAYVAGVNAGRSAGSPWRA